MSVAELESAVQRHNVLYFLQNDPEISDYEFDRLVERLRELAPDSPVLKGIGAGAAETESLGRPVVHARPMLSLDKCYAETELLRWATTFKGPIVESPKVDGVAASFRYGADGKLQLAATRGDGTQGEEFTSNALLIPNVPNELRRVEGHEPSAEIEVRGEIYMPLSRFARYAGEAKNPRNLTAGTLKRKHADRGQVADLRFFAYDLLGIPFATEMEKNEILRALGFEPVESLRLDREEVQAGYERWLGRRDGLDFEVDGVVYKADRVSEHARLGYTAHHPRFAIAYKFQGDSGRSTLLDVAWSVARTGTITPVAIIEPVNLSGAEVERCSLHTLNIFRRQALSLGDTIVAMRRGGVIPHVEASLGGGHTRVRPPSTCPACGADAVIERDTLACSAPRECRGVRIAGIEYFCKQAGIEGFGQKVLEALYDKELVRDPADLFEIQARALVTKVDLVGDVLARKLVAQVDAARQMPFDVFLRALGIPGLGRQSAGLLAERYADFATLEQATAAELQQIPGVGPELVRAIEEGLQEREALLARLAAHIHFEGSEAPADEGPLAGQSVVFTGKLAALDRKSAQEKARQAGAKTPSGVTKDLSLLVIGDEGSPLFGDGRKSSKHKKAERYNAEGASIVIISETEFLRRLGE